MVVEWFCFIKTRTNPSHWEDWWHPHYQTSDVTCLKKTINNMCWLVPLEIDDNCWDRVVTQAQAPKSRKRPVGKQLSPIPIAATSFPASQLWKSSYPWVFFFKEFTRWREITRYTHWIPSVLRSISEDMRCQIPFASEIKAFARNTPDVVFFRGSRLQPRNSKRRLGYKQPLADAIINGWKWAFTGLEQMWTSTAYFGTVQVDKVYKYQRSQQPL